MSSKGELSHWGISYALVVWGTYSYITATARLSIAPIINEKTPTAATTVSCAAY